MSLTAETQNRSQASLVWLRGDVTEQVSFPELLKVPAGHDLILYLADVRRLNSFGVREWIRGMQAVQAAARTIIWVECSYNVVQQLNMIKSFAGGARICSVRAPFTCEKDNTQEEHSINVVDWNGALPTVRCPKCGNVMELDEEPESFLAFRESEGEITQEHRDLFQLYLNWNNPNAVRSGPKATPARVEPPTPVPAPSPAARATLVAEPPSGLNKREGERGTEAHSDLKARYFLYGFAAGAVATAITMGLWMAAVMSP